MFSYVTAMFLYFEKDVLNVCGVRPAIGRKRVGVTKIYVLFENNQHHLVVPLVKKVGVTFWTCWCAEFHAEKTPP